VQQERRRGRGRGRGIQRGLHRSHFWVDYNRKRIREGNRVISVVRAWILGGTVGLIYNGTNHLVSDKTKKKKKKGKEKENKRRRKGDCTQEGGKVDVNTD